MKQAWLTAPGGPWELREVPIPKPGPGQMLVKVKCGSICKQTDSNTIRALHPPHDHQAYGQVPHHLRIWDGREDPLKDVYPKRHLLYPDEPYPSRMGHEMSGEVVEVNPVASNNHGPMFVTGHYQVGDRVTGSPIFGGFGEYILLDMSAAAKFPQDMSWEAGTLVEPVYCVANHVCSTVQIGDRVVVLGVGALGSIAMMIAKAMGAKQVVAVDKTPSKLAFAQAHGADVCINVNEVDNVADAIWDATDDEGADSILECAGEPETIQIIPYIGKIGARIGQIGACCVPVLIDWSYFHFRHMSINKLIIGGNTVGDLHLAEFQRAIDFIYRGVVPVEDLITHRFRLTQEDLEQAFHLAMTDEDMIKGIFTME